MPPLPRTMPENDSQNSNSPTPHKLEHISRIIRQQYPELHQANETLQRRQRMLNQSVVIATCTVLVATPAAIHLFANEKLLAGLAALVCALGTAFAPKIYADFIQPNRSQLSQPETTDLAFARQLLADQVVKRSDDSRMPK